MEYNNLKLVDKATLWFVIISHIVVLGIMLYNSNQISNDGVWNSYTASYPESQEKGLSTSMYVAYLFWNVTDTPGDDPHVSTESEDYLDSWGYLGVFVTFILFFIYEILVYLYFSKINNKKRFKYLAVLILMSCWLIFDTYRLVLLLG